MTYLSIPHYRGLKEKYNEAIHSDGLYFTTDTHELIANKATYGESIDTWTIEDGVLTITMTSGKNVVITFPEASETSKGLLSAEDKKKLDELENSIEKVKTDIIGNATEDYNTLGKIQEKIHEVGKTTTSNVDVDGDIVVSGGPLAGLLNQAGINSINKDTNMQDLLIQLFTKNTYPSVTFSEGNLTCGISYPNFSVDATLVEIGQIINVSACSASSVTYNTTPRKYSGISYGYTTDKTTKISDKEITVNASGITYEGQYTISRSGSVPEESKSGSNLEDIKLDSTSFVANEGSNTITVKVSGPKVICDFAETPEFWYYSNLGQLSDSKKYDAKSSITKITTTPSNSKSITVTGVYPIYATTNSITTLTKQTLQTEKEYVITLVGETNTDKQKFALPLNYQISNIKIYNTFANIWEDYNLNNFVTSSTTLECGGKNVDYTLYTRNEDKTGQSKFKILLK